MRLHRHLLLHPGPAPLQISPPAAIISHKQSCASLLSAGAEPDLRFLRRALSAQKRARAEAEAPRYEAISPLRRYTAARETVELPMDLRSTMTNVNGWATAYFSLSDRAV